MDWRSLSDMVTMNRSSWPRWARALTTPWVVSPIVVIALLVVAFEGYGYYTRHQPTTYARGGQFGGANLPASDSHHANKSKQGKGKHAGTQTISHLANGSRHAGHNGSTQSGGGPSTGGAGPTSTH
jgi:hypothetical protein